MDATQRTSPFGALLRRYRAERGLSQEELAAQAGLSVHSISALERGITPWPYRDTVVRLASALGLAPAEQQTLAAAARRPARRSVRPAESASAPLPSAGAATTLQGESRPATLPTPPTPLIGRSMELGRLERLLTRPEGRLLTVTGPGGIGKTRLALEAAHRLHGTSADWVVFVELAPLQEGPLVAAALAHALDVRDAPGHALSEAITTYVGVRGLLLVLDNCEHLIDACAALVAHLLAACPRLRVLATSRTALRLRGEQVFPLTPLALPPLAAGTLQAVIRNSPAVALFVERAAAVAPDFALSAANAPDIAAICRRLDGLPLAIELAAAHCAYLSPRALLARLTPSLPLLSGSARDLPTRQQTLRAAIIWSYDLLPAEEQRVFCLLAVCVSGCTLTAATALCAVDSSPTDPLAMLPHLETLVGASLLLPVPLEDDEPRFAMLETIREYGLERLEQSGEGAAARARHLAWCLALAERAEPELTGPQQEHWLARLEAEHDNLRAALGWATRSWLESAAQPAMGGAPAVDAPPPTEAGLRLAAALWRFWFTRGYLAEGRRWLTGALAGDGGSPAARAKALHGAGILAWRQGDYGPAVALHAEALALRRALGDTQGIAASLNNLGLVVGEQGDYGQARTLYEESLALQRALGDSQGIANALNNLGILARQLGDYARATALYEESLALQRALGNTQGMAAALGNLGRVAERLGNLERAAALLEEALALARELGDTREMALSLRSLGTVARMQGDVERAAALLAESLALSRDLGARDLMADVLKILSWVAVARGQPLRAAHLGGAAQALREALGVPLPPYQQADHDQAVAAMRAALGEGEFAAAWAAGAGLSLEQALAETAGVETAVSPRSARPTALVKARLRQARGTPPRGAPLGQPRLHVLPGGALKPLTQPDATLGDGERAE